VGLRVRVVTGAAGELLLSRPHAILAHFRSAIVWAVPAPVVPARFRLSAEELAEVVARGALLGIQRWRIYAALDVRSADTE
jgi:hypothetical protein